jgi:hypothetical protein
MRDDQDLKTLEQRTFRTVVDDGLWDVVIAAFFAMFAFAPLLSERLGDFWSAAVFVPVWVATYSAVRVVRHRVIAPRVGTVRFGADRRQWLQRLGFVMVAVNALAAAAGVLAFIAVQLNWLDLADGGVAYPLVLGMIVLIGFSLAARITGITRYYAYGLLLAVAALVGEWLWREGLAAHHGYPVMFGSAAAIILFTGLVRFTVIVRSHPAPHHTAMV